VSLLAPLFLLGTLAVALPVVFHLIRRTTRERTIFSSLMFLVPSPPRLTHRSRLEHLLLLAFRCLVLCLLAMGFSRPFFKKPMTTNPSSGAGRRTVFLVDSSASMRRADLWQDARKQIEAALRDVTPADQVALITFGRQSDTLLTFDQWTQMPLNDRAPALLRKLSDASPGWSATHLGDALLSAAESLADTAGKPWAGSRQIILVSDLQEGSRLDQLQGYEWPKGLDVSVEQLKPKHVSNAGLQLVTDSDDSDSKATAGVRLRISNAAGSKREAFKVGWAQPNARGFLGKPLDVYVPPGQSRIVALDSTTNSQTSSSSRITLEGDEDDFDNSVFVIPAEQSRLDVVYIGSDPESDPHQPLFFLKRAFQDTRRQSVQVTSLPPDQPIATKDAALYVVTEALTTQSARALHELASAGKTILFAPKDAQAASALGPLLGTEPVKIEEAQLKTYAMLADIDFRHPLFAPFADPRFSDFTHIHFWKYRRLDAASIPGAHILAKFDSGDPAIIEAPVGKGRVLIFDSGWNRDDSQLALSTKFVPMLYALLESSGDVLPLPTQYYVGDVVPLTTLAGAGQIGLTVRQPDGVEMKINADTTNFSRTLTPGIYEVSSTAGKPTRFAVNLDPAESRTAPLPIDELDRLGVPMARQKAVASREAARQARLQNAELESRQKLWRWLLAATLLVVLGETWLASHTSRQVAAQA
jgi:hypothetical protein